MLGGGIIHALPVSEPEAHSVWGPCDFASNAGHAHHVFQESVRPGVWQGVVLRAHKDPGDAQRRPSFLQQE